MMNKILLRIRSLYLDIISLPGIFMSKKGNAKLHLNYICPQCPMARRAYRDVEGKGRCWWNENWKKGNYDIPRNFGPRVWFRSYLGLKSDMKKFKK